MAPTNCNVIKPNMMTVIESAIATTPDIAGAYMPGLKALGANSKKIMLTAPCEGSVDIDAAIAKKYPSAYRWDYAFGYQSKIHFVEVHSAHTSEVSVVLKNCNG